MFKTDYNIQDKTLKIEMELEHLKKEVELYKKAIKVQGILLKPLSIKEIQSKICRIKT